MSLVVASTAEHSDLRFMVRSVGVVKVYYVWTGRNAWWSTWSTRYSPGCFHRDLASAKAFCEKRRVQGTVFYIDELPSVALLAPERVLTVSEINTASFLSKFDVRRLASITTAFPVSTMTLRQFWYLFRVNSALWPADHPRQNSSFVSFFRGVETFETVTPKDQLSSYSSSSVGPDYYLRWNLRPFEKDSSHVHAIADALTGRLGEF